MVSVISPAGNASSSSDKSDSSRGHRWTLYANSHHFMGGPPPEPDVCNVTHSTSMHSVALAVACSVPRLGSEGPDKLRYLGIAAGDRGGGPLKAQCAA